MKQILVYTDSLAWGIIPGTRNRLEFSARWPGVLENELIARGVSVRVIEDCLNGRRTVWDDPFKPGRNGLVGLAQTIEKHSPLALVVLALGTNDLQSTHGNNAWHSAQGMAALVTAIKTAPVEPGMPIPPILIVAPPTIRSPAGTMAPKFAGAEEKSAGMADAYKNVARLHGCHFLDAATVTPASKIDGVHLDRDQHMALGKAIAAAVIPILTGAG